MQSDAGRAMAHEVLTELNDALKSWNEIAEADRVEVGLVLEDLASLSLQAAGGADVSAEVAQVRAQVAAWEWVAESYVRQLALEAIDRVLSRVLRAGGELGAAFVWSALKGLAGEALG